MKACQDVIINLKTVPLLRQNGGFFMSTNKGIYFVASGVAELRDKGMPDISDKPNFIIVKTMVSSVSAGTERANLLCDPSNSAGTMRFPCQLGYSLSGVVVKVGDAVTRVKVGDRVACRWTTHSLYNAIDQSLATIIPDNVSFEEASLSNIATFPMAAIRKCRLELAESAIVMGLGVLGIFAVAELKLAGAAPIIAVDPIPEKRELALKLGADYAFDPFEEGFAKKVKEVTGGGAKVAIEVTGKGQGLDMVLDCMAKFGRVALLGCTRNSDFTIDYYRKVHTPGITLVGAHTSARPNIESHEGWWTQSDDMEATLRLISLGRFDVKSLIDETHTPDKAPEIYARLAKSPTFPIVQFDWREL